MRIVGIDPGTAGALALLDEAGAIIDIKDMPTFSVKVNGSNRPRVAAAQLSLLLKSWNPDHAVYEVQNPRKDDKYHPAQAAELMRAAGVVEGVIAALAIPYTPVQPAAWRKAMGCSIPTPSTYKERKAASRRRAQQLYPSHADRFVVEDSSDLAEAVLIGMWGLRAFFVMQGVRNAA
jgi:crossover junction endodeoxyribonuclease RuvC